MRKWIALFENQTEDLVDSIIDACDFTEDDLDSATSQYCGTFALALYGVLTRRHIKCGLALCIVNDETGKPKYDSKDGVPYWRHAAVKVNGEYYDICGKTNPEWMRENYCWKAQFGSTMVDVSPEELIDILNKTGQSHSLEYFEDWTSAMEAFDRRRVQQR